MRLALFRVVRLWLLSGGSNHLGLGLLLLLSGSPDDLGLWLLGLDVGWSLLSGDVLRGWVGWLSSIDSHWSRLFLHDLHWLLSGLGLY